MMEKITGKEENEQIKELISHKWHILLNTVQLVIPDHGW